MLVTTFNNFWVQIYLILEINFALPLWVTLYLSCTPYTILLATPMNQTDGKMKLKKTRLAEPGKVESSITWPWAWFSCGLMASKAVTSEANQASVSPWLLATREKRIRLGLTLEKHRMVVKLLLKEFELWSGDLNRGASRNMSLVLMASRNRYRCWSHLGLKRSSSLVTT